MSKRQSPDTSKARPNSRGSALEKDAKEKEEARKRAEADTDVDEVMRKYDRESNTRIWEGTPKIVISIMLAAFSVYCIFMTLFSTALPETRLSLFLAFVTIVGYMMYPIRKSHVRPNHMPWYDIVLMAVGAACFFYFAFNATDDHPHGLAHPAAA